jgi:hypothetical protein
MNGFYGGGLQLIRVCGLALVVLSVSGAADISRLRDSRECAAAAMRLERIAPARDAEVEPRWEDQLAAYRGCMWMHGHRVDTRSDPYLAALSACREVARETAIVPDSDGRSDLRTVLHGCLVQRAIGLDALSNDKANN